MLSFLFWNLRGRPLQEYIANLASLYKLDVIMLTECSIDTADLLRKLNPQGKSEYNYSEGRLCERVKIFTRFSENFITTLGENSRMTIRHLHLAGKTDIILAVTHFYSKLYKNEQNQARRCRKLINMIELEEKKLGHSRTILVGDLNMNPFDTGMIDATGMHSVMSRQIAQKETRIIEGCTYKFFYNPMWGLFGIRYLDLAEHIFMKIMIIYLPFGICLIRF